MGEQTGAPMPSHDPPAAYVGKAWIHAARQSGMRACRELGSSNRPTKPAPRLLASIVSLHRFMQTTAPADPPDGFPVSFSNGNEDSSFFSDSFFLAIAGHFLSDPISFGVSPSMPNRCRVSESTRLPEPGLECIWPALGNGGALPVQDRSWAFRGGELGCSFDLSRPIILGVSLGRRQVPSFFFLSFSWSSSRGCVETTTTTSIPGPVTPPIHREGEAAAVCLSVRTARANLTWKGGTHPGGTLPASPSPCLTAWPNQPNMAQPVSSRFPIGGADMIEEGQKTDGPYGEIGSRWGWLHAATGGCSSLAGSRVDRLNLHNDDRDDDGGRPDVSHGVRRDQ